MRANKYLNEYDDAWIEEGFSISPFSLPLKKKVFFRPRIIFEACVMEELGIYLM